MMRRILTFTVFVGAVAAVVPVLSKGKRAAVGVTPRADKVINMPATLKKKAEIFAGKAGNGELVRVGSNGYLNSKRRLNDLHLRRVNLWQDIASSLGMKPVPAIGKEDPAFGAENIVSVSDAKVSFRKVAAFIPNNGGPGQKLLIELWKVDVYNPGRIAGIRHNSKTAAGISLGTNHVLTSKSIDTLLYRLNKNAFINLGQVAPAFFDNLMALDGHHKIEAGRLLKLSTTNAKVAKLSLGGKSYYRKNKQTGSAMAASKSASSKVYEMVNNELSVEFKPDMSNDDELHLSISVKIANSIENPGGTLSDPVISKSDANLTFYSGDVIVIGGIGQLEASETSAHDSSYKWVFMGLPKPKSGFISMLFIKPTVIR